MAYGAYAIAQMRISLVKPYGQTAGVVATMDDDRRCGTDAWCCGAQVTDKLRNIGDRLLDGKEAQIQHR